jgi:hypothetical protein
VSQNTHRRRQPISERARPAQRPRIPDPQAPSDDLNKLPIICGPVVGRSRSDKYSDRPDLCVHRAAGSVSQDTSVDATECPVLTRVAACVSSPARLARIADFRGATGNCTRPACPAGTFAMRTRMRAPPPWPAITAAGPGNHRSKCLKNRPFSASCQQPVHGRARAVGGTHQIGQLPVPEDVWDEYTHRRLPACWPGRPPRGNSSPHSSASSNGRILRCWVSSQP